MAGEARAERRNPQPPGPAEQCAVGRRLDPALRHEGVLVWGYPSVPAPMRGKFAILAAVAVDRRRALLVLALGGGKLRRPESQAVTAPGRAERGDRSPLATAPGRPSHAVVVKVEVENFRLSPGRFGREAQLGEGHIRFGLDRFPDCVDPVKLLRAIDSPFGNGRLVGPSFDFPQYSGPNGCSASGRRGRQLLAGDPAGDLLPRAPAGLLPPGRQPDPEQRRNHPLPRRHQLPGAV